MRGSRTGWVAGIAAAAVLVGCGGRDGTADGDAVDAAAPEEEPADGTDADGADGTATADPGADEEAAEVDVAVATTELGEVLVDGAGMTLYLFTEDQDGRSVCEDACAQAWPPLLVDDAPAAGAGADVSLLGTTTRGDGSTQVTYAGAPLYTWAGDGGPGDVTGQGVQDVWFVVAPDGSAVTDAGGAPAAGAEGGGTDEDQDPRGY